MKKWVIIVLFGVLAGCRVSCFGDSNTAATFPNPAAPIKKWVQYLSDDLGVGWDAVEHGVPSRRLVDAATPDGLAEIDAQLETDGATVAVFAYGSVDAFWIAWSQETEDEAATALTTIVNHVHTKYPIVTVYVALVPHTFGNPFWAPDAVVDSLNARITALVPANRLIDFAGSAIGVDTWDGLHFCGDPPIAPCTTPHGQQVRAAVAKAAIRP